MEFEWNPRKAATNLRKHKVSFDEASTVFGAPRRRPLMVAHTDRGGRIRIITARTLTKAERRAYEEINP